MIKRTIVVQGRNYVSTENEQLRLENRNTGELQTLPIEDIGYLEFENTQCTLTTSAMARLAHYGVTVTFCDERFTPVAQCLPIEGNALQAQRLKIQVNASAPAQKRIWQILVQKKIRNQERVLKALGYSDVSLEGYAQRVLSGDKTNREGAAARRYWQHVLGNFGVKRDPEGDYPNNVLNYGYAVLRAVVSRAIVRAGLHPSFGIHHSNQFNAFALSDDVMEPYRPFVDFHVLSGCCLQNPEEILKPQHKREILAVLTADVVHSIGTRPLFNSVETLCAQLVQALDGNLKALDLPSFPE